MSDAYARREGNYALRQRIHTDFDVKGDIERDQKNEIKRIYDAVPMDKGQYSGNNPEEAVKQTHRSDEN